MSEPVMWIIPEAPPPEGGTAQATRRAAGGGIRFGVLDNSKSNADHLLAMIIEGVKAKLPVGAVVSVRKPSAANGAPAEVLEQLAQEADVVVSAMAD